MSLNIKNLDMKINSAAVVYIETAPEDILLKIKKALEEQNIISKFFTREKIRKLKANAFKSSDIILSIGGDGTFLTAAQYNKNLPMLGINTNTREKEGFFTRAIPKNFKRIIKEIIERRFKIISLNRLNVFVGKRKIPELVLNDVFFGAEKAYHACHYRICINGKCEYQRSSGVIIATAAGSHAWLKSAGGAQLKLDSKKIQFLVREPYFGRIHSPKMIKGFIHSIKLCPLKDVKNMIVVLDSVSREYIIKPYETVEVMSSEYPLKFIEPLYQMKSGRH